MKSPFKGKLYHDRSRYSDWGCIRDESGYPVINFMLPDYDEDVLNEHRKNKTDPTQDRVDFILAAVNEYVLKEGRAE